MSPWRVVRHRALGRGSASGSLARFELSAQARRRSEDLAPAASTTSKRSAMLAHIRRRSWSREHRASCGSRMRGPSGPRARASASSAALRSTRRASATFKRGASQAPSRGDGHAGIPTLLAQALAALVVDHRALGGGSASACASGSLARFELSAQDRRRSEDLTPAASTTSEPVSYTHLTLPTTPYV